MKLTLALFRQLNYSIPITRTFVYLKYACKVSGDGLSQWKDSEVASALGVSPDTIRAHVNALHKLKLLSKGRRPGYRVAGWKRIQRKEESQAIRSISIGPDAIFDKDLFKEIVLMGVIEFQRRYKAYKGPKKALMRAINKCPFKLSAVEFGALFGRSKAWGSMTRNWLVKRGAMLMKRCIYPVDPCGGLAKAAESLGIHVHWSEAKKGFVREDVADIVCERCPFVRVRRS